MPGRLLEWLADRLFERHDIGRAGDPYLTRWVVAGERFGPGRKVFLHLFHRSDYAGALHNHPWPFWSLVLGPGYWEWTDAGRRWYGPLRLLARPPSWRHRVEIPAGRRCWSLVWAGDKVQSWGFFCPRGFVPWREYVGREEAGAAGCGEEG